MEQKKLSDRMDTFKHSLDEFQKKLSVENAQAPQAEGQAFEEIQTLVEELNVAIEELEVQNEELEISWRTVEVERQRYKELFDFAPDGYLVTDKYGTIQEANRAAGKLLNVLPKHLIGKPLPIYIYKEDLLVFRNFLAYLVAEPVESPVHKELHLQPRDSEPVPVSLTIALSKVEPAMGEADLILRWIIRDMTDMHQLMEQLRASNENLEQRIVERTEELVRKNKELQEFAFMASHDLEEPLRKVKVFAGLIVDNYGSALPKHALEYFDRLQKANDRMDDMLHGLLHYSRVTTQAKAFLPTDLNPILDGVLFDLELVIEKCHATIEKAELPVIEADAYQMRQLLQNLINNALKFKHPDVSPQVRIWAKEAGPDYVKLLVQDNGIGFSEEYNNEIFLPFRRLNARSAYSGSGMGLAIAQKIVERHHGEIWAASEPGKGATFTVLLPRKQPTGE